MVELVLISPFLFLLVGGIIQFALALNYWLDMQRLANQGARWAVVARYPLEPPNTCTTVNAPCSPALTDTLAQQAQSDGLEPGGVHLLPERHERRRRARARPPRDRLLVRTHSRYRHGDPRCRR